jgi:hypothetical protein
MNITEQIENLERLEEQEQDAFMNHADMEAAGIYTDIVNLKKRILPALVSSYGSGYIANIIGSTKYAQIDKAVNKTLAYLYHAEDEKIHDIPVNAEAVTNLIKACYKALEQVIHGQFVPVLT